MERADAGRIVAFCSPKGGVGRSTAVANLAWVLATSGRRVLVADWDLESPSLHEYFRPFLLDPQLSSTEGVIDAVGAITLQSVRIERGRAGGQEYQVEFHPGFSSGVSADPQDDDGARLLGYAVSLDWEFPQGGALDFLPAGRQSPAYPVRVAEMDWAALLDSKPGYHFVESVGRAMRSRYDVVLIDIHCGLNDAGRTCAVHLADAVALCFTLMPSSIEGARKLAEMVASERTRMPAKYFPVPMRVDPFEKELLERGRKQAREAFEPYLSLTGPERESYWADVEVPYIPYYAYSEVLAPFGDRPGDANSVLAAVERLASRVVGEPITAQVYGTLEASRKVIAQYEAPGPA